MAAVKPWDDLQLLRSIHDLERSESGALSEGLTLMSKLRPVNEQDQQQDPYNFARELNLARDAGYLTFELFHYGQPQPYDWHKNAYFWLQRMGSIRLTLAGRDRALGRVVISELPDADEDDGRIITGLAMEEIARSIGDTYTPAQLPRYLRESGLPEGAVPETVIGDKWQYVFDVLESLHEGGSAARRALREFVGGWLEGYFHAPPLTEVRKRITALLAQQGWQVRDGRLVVGERVRVEPGTVSPLGRDARLAALHADIRLVTGRFVEDHLDVAIFEAFKAINNRVKRMSGLDLDGSPLMDEALGAGNPRVVFADGSTKTGRDIQQGLHFMFKGAVQGIRNPDAHEQFKALEEEEGLEVLAFASMLMRRLDGATVREKP